MSSKNLPYAFCRHATSKIERFEDLYKLSSFGFRGEALASISAISRLTCTSAPADNPQMGGKIIIHGSKTITHCEQPATISGTSLFIKDLFYNTPARLKFIKSQISEKNALKRIIESFIISNPQVTFSIKWDQSDKDFYPATQKDIRHRIAQVLYKNKKPQELYHFKSEYEGHTVSLFLTKNSTKGNANKKHFLFANQRLFTDKQIHQTIIRNCDGLYPHGEMGHYCVFLDIPANLIDVNVHPNKTQIKFFKLPVITALISAELKKLKKIIEPIHEQENILFPPTQTTPSKVVQNTFNHSPNTTQNYHAPSEAIYNSSDNQYAKINNTQQILNSSQESCCPIQQIYSKDRSYIVYKYEFMKSFLKQRLELYTDDLNDYIPLLISSPIHTSVEQARNERKRNYQYEINQLQNIGLQVEKLDSNTLVLRSYHKVYQDFPIEHFITLFVENECNINFLKDSPFLFTNKWCLHHINQQTGVREISPQLLNTIFYE